MKRAARFLLVAALAVLPVHAERPVSVASLAEDPARYDRRSVEISTFVSHGFEDFTLLDPASENDVRVWAEYGGALASGTVYCCGVTAERQRKAPLEVEGVETHLIQDQQFQAFDRILRTNGETVVHATLRGRFFAGEETALPSGRRWTGYGHFGLYSLFVIEQVVSIDHTAISDVDYDITGAVPHYADSSCFPPVPRVEYREAIGLQQQADAGRRAWSFSDPARVATTRLTESLGRPVRILRTVSRSPGRVVYEVAVAGTNKKYWATVSRPYWLTFFAAQPDRVAWIVLGTVDTECAKE